MFFVRGGNLMAQSFNEKTLKLEGEPVPLRSAGRPRHRLPVLGLRERPTGVPLAERGPQLTWLDRSGRPVGTVGDPGILVNLDLSPDGQQVAVTS